MKCTLGEVRYVMAEIAKKISKMEAAGIVKPQAATQILWYQAEFDKELVAFLNKRGDK